MGTEQQDTSWSEMIQPQESASTSTLMKTLSQPEFSGGLQIPLVPIDFTGST